MDDAAHVRDAQSAGHIQPDPRRLGRNEPADPLEPRRQILAFDEFHDQERLTVIRPGLEAGDQVRVAQDRRSERLTSEAHRQIGVPDHLASEQLDGHRPVEIGIQRAVDGRHPADPDDLAEPVPPGHQPSDIGGGRHGVAGLRHRATIAEVRGIGSTTR